MSNMTQLLNIVEDLRGKIEMPEISDAYLRTVWVMGRNAGANKVRTHVRHNMNEKLPYLKQAPKALRQQLGQTGADVWLNGYNAAVEYVERQVNVLVFHATQGQALVARFNK